MTKILAETLPPGMAYEWTDMPYSAGNGFVTDHRNVIFSTSAVPAQPLDSAHYTDPPALWNGLASIRGVRLYGPPPSHPRTLEYFSGSRALYTSKKWLISSVRKSGRPSRSVTCSHRASPAGTR